MMLSVNQNVIKILVFPCIGLPMMERLVVINISIKNKESKCLHGLSKVLYLKVRPMQNRVEEVLVPNEYSVLCEI